MYVDRWRESVYVDRLRESMCVCRERERKRDGRGPGTVRVWPGIRPKG